LAQFHGGAAYASYEAASISVTSKIVDMRARLEDDRRHDQPPTQESDMTAAQTTKINQTATTTAMRLEVVQLPVADVERAKRFYASLGWRFDAEFAHDDFHIVQITPPGSAASIIFGRNVTSAVPGSVEDLVLAVDDIDAARDELVSRGVEVSEVFHDAGGVFHHAGTDARVPGPAPEHATYGSFASFRDPDGNGWLLQEIKTRLPGRVTGASFADASELAEALRRAAAAHGEHEERTGEYDAEWPAWYAAYVVAEATGAELPS
jgi:predicted enzyme related to lactoylglutathione lyase